MYEYIQILALGRMKSAMKSVFGGVILSARSAVPEPSKETNDDALSPRPTASAGASASASSSVTPATVPVSATATGTTTGATTDERVSRDDDMETNAHQLSTLVRRYSSIGVPVLESHASLFSVLSSGSKSTDVPVVRQVSKDTDEEEGATSPRLLVVGEQESFEVRNNEPEQSLSRSTSVALPNSAKREMETQLEALLSAKHEIIERISEEQSKLEKLTAPELLLTESSTTTSSTTILAPEQLEQRREESKRRLSQLAGDLQANGKKIKVMKEL